MAVLDLTIHRTALAQAQSTTEQTKGGGGGGGGGTGDINLSNILKLIPGDVVAIYLAGKGLTVPAIAGLEWAAVLFWLCLIVCIVLRVIAARAGGGFNFMLVIVTAVAFFVWAHAVSEVGPVVAAFKGSAAGIVAMLLGLVAPKLVPAEPGS